MQINITPQKVNSASGELLELARAVRRSRAEVEDAARQLRQLSGLDECLSALRRQEEGLELLTGRLVNMSSSLMEISALYAASEERIAGNLEEERSRREPGDVLIYGVNSGIHSQINSILHRGRTD